MRSLGLILLVVLWSAPPAPAQSGATRVGTMTAGLGNVHGWFGLQGERYFANERFSALIGVGYTPSIDGGDAAGASFAIGLRGFTPGIRHRGFLALTLSQLVVMTGGMGSSRGFYGPGLEAGYQFVAGGGFTLIASAGVGYAPGVNKVAEQLALGFGYTWRRRT